MATSLIINPGSSSKKYAFYKAGESVLSIVYEKTEAGFALCVSQNNTQPKCDISDAVDYSDTTKLVIAKAKELGVIKDESDIDCVGLRVVAPGEYFREHKVIDGEFITKLKQAQSYAPLHAPLTLTEIELVREVLPKVTLIGVSDSAFHSTVPEARRLYSVAGAAGAGIKKFGYHGLSVASVARRLQQLGIETEAKVAVVHVGNGVSVVGLNNGQSEYTSMGYTPASGVMMSSRAGDMDPGALIEILHTHNLSGEAAQRFIQQEGGFMGLLGITDIRGVLAQVAKKDQAATVAFDKFIFEIAAQITKAATAMSGLDAIIFTGTAVERNPELRQIVIARLNWLGVFLNEDINISVHNTTSVISSSDSRVVVAAVPTDEMGEMSRICESFTG